MDVGVPPKSPQWLRELGSEDWIENGARPANPSNKQTVFQDVAIRDILRYAFSMAFNVRAFGKLSETPQGRRVWELVRDPAIQANMIAAARLNRPSVEILAEDLVRIIPAIAKPGAGVRETAQAKRVRDQWRRFAGAVVGHVMVEELGWRIDRQRVRIPASNPVFNTGTTYVRA